MSAAILIPKIIAIAAIPTIFVASGLTFTSFKPQVEDFLVSRWEEGEDDATTKTSVAAPSSGKEMKCRVAGYELIDRTCKLFHIMTDATDYSPDLKNFNKADKETRHEDIGKYDFFKIRLDLKNLPTIYYGYKNIIEVFKSSDEVNSTKPLAKFKIEALAEKNVLRAYVSSFVVFNTNKLPESAKPEPEHFELGETDTINKFFCSFKELTEDEEKKIIANNQDIIVDVGVPINNESLSAFMKSKEQKEKNNNQMSACVIDMLENKMVNPKKINASKSSSLQNSGTIDKVKPEHHYIVRLSQKHVLGSVAKEQIINLFVYSFKMNESSNITDTQRTLGTKKISIFKMKVEHPVALRFKTQQKQNPPSDQTKKSKDIQTVFLL